MKRYELKDKERQAALEKIFPGFGEDLQAACEDEYGDSTRYVEMQLSDCNGIFFNDETVINKDAITTKEVYDPHAWNDYPNVTPPEGVLMRIEGRDDDDDAFHFSGYFKNRMWVDEYGYALATNIYTVERFRPWDEEKES